MLKEVRRDPGIGDFFFKIKIMQPSDAHTEFCWNSGFGDSTAGGGQHSPCSETKQLEAPTFQHKNNQLSNSMTFLKEKKTVRPSSLLSSPAGPDVISP